MPPNHPPAPLPELRRTRRAWLGAPTLDLDSPVTSSSAMSGGHSKGNCLYFYYLPGIVTKQLVLDRSLYININYHNKRHHIATRLWNTSDEDTHTSARAEGRDGGSYATEKRAHRVHSEQNRKRALKDSEATGFTLTAIERRQGIRTRTNNIEKSARHSVT